MKNYFEKKNDVASGKSVTTLTDDGRDELKRLENKYLHTMRVSWLKQYDLFSDEEKLMSLLDKNKREEKKAKPVTSEKRSTITDYLLSNPDFDWLDMDLHKLEDIENIFKSYIEDIEIAKQLILCEKIDKELAEQLEKRSDIESKIQELQNAKKNILGIAA